MPFEYMKASIVAVWVLILAAAALSLGVASATGWLVLVGVGLIPPMMLFRLWRQPAQTMSESIHEVTGPRASGH